MWDEAALSLGSLKLSFNAGDIAISPLVLVA
jgi:hypothetical protein